MNGQEHIADAVCTGSQIGVMGWEHLDLVVDGVVMPIRLSALDEFVSLMGFDSWIDWMNFQWVLPRNERPRLKIRPVQIIEWVPLYHGKFEMPRANVPTKMKATERYNRAVMAWGVIPRGVGGQPEINPYAKVRSDEWPGWGYEEIAKVTLVMRSLEVGEAMVISTESCALLKKWCRMKKNGWALIERPIRVGAVAIWRMR